MSQCDSLAERGRIWRFRHELKKERNDERQGRVSQLENGTGRFRILVVEDEPLIRKMVCDVLQFIGHHASGAAAGAEGVALFERDRHDLVITDLQMPGLSGWDVIERLHQTDQAVPVIILTGFATSEDMERARVAGIRLLEKPLHIRELEAAIQSSFRSRADGVLLT